MALITIDELSFNTWLSLQNPNHKESLMVRCSGEELYHVSPNHNIRRFFPAIPTFTKLGEDRSVARICTSTTILDALIGMIDTSGFSRFSGEDLCIYKFNPKISIRPTKKILPNISNLNERWIVGYDPTRKAYESHVCGKVKIKDTEQTEDTVVVIGYVTSKEEVTVFNKRTMYPGDLYKFWITGQFEGTMLSSREVEVEKVTGWDGDWDKL